MHLISYLVFTHVCLSEEPKYLPNFQKAGQFAIQYGEVQKRHRLMCSIVAVVDVFSAVVRIYFSFAHAVCWSNSG